MGTKRSKSGLKQREIAEAFIAWYKAALKDPAFKGGMVTRAQAARILGVSNMAVERLVGRGHIRAKYFPKEPDIENLAVGSDDPFLYKLGRESGLPEGELLASKWFPAVYVSLDDVVALLEKGEQQEQSRVNWRTFLSLMGGKK